MTPDTVTIRPAVSSDAEAVTACSRAAYGKYVARLGREPLPMTANYREVIAEHQVWLVDGENCCIAVLVLIRHPDHLLIENVAVDPRFQGAGLGRFLLDFAETEARRQNLAELRLYTNEKMTENVAMYLKRGYRETDRRALEGRRAVFMAKRLET